MAADCQTKLGTYDLARHAPRHLNGQSPTMRAALSRKECAPCKTRQLTEEGPTKIYSLPGPPKCPLTEPFWSVIVVVCGKPLQQWRPRGSEEQVQLQYACHILWALNAFRVSGFDAHTLAQAGTDPHTSLITAAFHRDVRDDNWHRSRNPKQIRSWLRRIQLLKHSYITRIPQVPSKSKAADPVAALCYHIRKGHIGV